MQLFELTPDFGFARDGGGAPTGESVAEFWTSNTQTLTSQIPLVSHQAHFPKQRQFPP